VLSGGSGKLCIVFCVCPNALRVGKIKPTAKAAALALSIKPRLDIFIFVFVD
jgi:hypothetical protein